MRKASGLLVAAALSVGSIATASAADMAVKARPMPVATVYDWTGWQIGFGFGVLDADADWRFLNGAAPDSFTGHRWDQVRVGLHGATQWMIGGMPWGGFVIGLESAATFPLDDTRGTSACPNPAFACQTNINSLFTTGGRVGLAWDRFMIYGSGGYALGQVQTRTIIGGVLVAPDEQWQDGYYIGAGIDVVAYKGTGIDLLLGFEYKHIDLGVDRHALAFGAINPGFTRDVDVIADQFMAKATLKFNGPRFW